MVRGQVRVVKPRGREGVCGFSCRFEVNKLFLASATNKVTRLRPSARKLQSGSLVCHRCDEHVWDPRELGWAQRVF
jgi:hypothetical protein